MNNTDIMKFLVSMTVMMNPLGALSIFLQLTRRYNLRHQRQLALHCGIAIGVIMLVSIWGGKEILNVLGITIDSFRFAGGIILLLMGLSMLQSKESAVAHTPEEDTAALTRDSIAVVPMALPIIIGPGSISTLIIAATDFPHPVHKLWLSGMCLGLGIVMTLGLYFCGNLVKLLGESMIKVITRIMGMIVMSLAVGMLASGLQGLIPTLR